MFNKKEKPEFTPDWNSAKKHTKKSENDLEMGSIVDLSVEEMEALAASKAAGLRDRDRKLAEEKEKERKKDERSKKTRRILEIVGLILLILLFMVQCNGNKSEPPAPTPPPVELEYENTDNIDIKPEEILDYSDGAAISFIAGVYTGYTLETGSSEFTAHFANHEDNEFPARFTLYLQTKKYHHNLSEMTKVYESKLVEAGQEKKGATLSENLNAGDYYVTLNIEWVSTETGNVIYYIPFYDIPLTVLN